jgi:hypothetical protein
MAEDIAGSSSYPFYKTDAVNCQWSWKTGKGIGLWAEDCKFDTGKWAVNYNEAADSFSLTVDNGEPFDVVRQFHKKAQDGPDAILGELKSKGLIPNDDECKFELSETQKNIGNWQFWEIMPVGKRREAFDAAPKDEIPEPPCGELGYAVDYVGFFMIDPKHADRVLYVNLGQDGSMFDPFTVSLF